MALGRSAFPQTGSSMAPRGQAWRLMLGTMGHHGGQGTGHTVNQSVGVGAFGPVPKVHGMGWAGSGDEDITLPRKAWELRNCVCRGLLEVRIEIWCKHTYGDACTHGCFLRTTQSLVSRCRNRRQCPIGCSDGGNMGLRVVPASLAHSCLAPIARGRCPRMGPGAGGGRCGSFPGRVEGHSPSWEHTWRGLLIPNFSSPLLTPRLHVRDWLSQSTGSLWCH